nr:hypothetical protein [Pseudarthrobacter psychrotolerans]
MRLAKLVARSREAQPWPGNGFLHPGGGGEGNLFSCSPVAGLEDGTEALSIADAAR